MSPQDTLRKIPSLTNEGGGKPQRHQQNTMKRDETPKRRPERDPPHTPHPARKKAQGETQEDMLER